MKPYVPQLRVISVEHDKTTLAAGRLRRALDAAGMKDYPIRSVFCHLEAGRCGVKAGMVAVEADGAIVWAGKELTEAIAAAFAEGLPPYVQRKKEEYGMG